MKTIGTLCALLLCAASATAQDPAAAAIDSTRFELGPAPGAAGGNATDVRR